MPPGRTSLSTPPCSRVTLAKVPRGTAPCAQGFGDGARHPRKAGAGTPMACPRSLHVLHPSPATYTVRPLSQSMLSMSPNPMRTAAHPPPSSTKRRPRRVLPRRVARVRATPLERCPSRTPRPRRTTRTRQRQSAGRPHPGTCRICPRRQTRPSPCSYLPPTALSGFGSKCSSRSTTANPIWRFSSSISLMLK